MYVIVFDSQLGRIINKKEFSKPTDCYEFGYRESKKYGKDVLDCRYGFKVLETAEEVDDMEKKVKSYPFIGETFNFVKYYKYYYSKDSYQQIIADTLDAMLMNRKCRNYSCFFRESKDELIIFHEYRDFECPSRDGHKEKIVIKMPKTEKTFKNIDKNNYDAYINTHNDKCNNVIFYKNKKRYNLTDFIERLCSVETFFDCETNTFELCEI